MANYSIKELSKVSGVQPHTIRIWEQRYGLFQPSRDKNNVRSYNDNQFRKLLNVCELMKTGMKISEISNLSTEQINLKIDHILDNTSKNEPRFDLIIDQLILSLSTFDEVLFDKIFSNSLLRFGIEETYLKVILPLLVKVGMLWCKQEIMPAQEHFLSNLIKQKLFALIDALPLKSNSKQTWVLYLDQEEEHEIGLLFGNYMLRNNGAKVVYLGSKVPFDNIIQVGHQVKATHFYSFFVKNRPNNEILEHLTILSLNFPNSKVVVSGNQPLLSEIIWNDSICYVNKTEELINFLV